MIDVRLPIVLGSRAFPRDPRTIRLLAIIEREQKMKLQHYLGGLEGLDRVDFEKRVFVEPWETRIFGIHTAMMALSAHLQLPQTASTFHDKWTWASLRTGAEGMNPFDYFKYRYYEKWLDGISGFF